MAKPDPVGGLVIRYDYLWRSEEAQGREEGSKERPCSVVIAVPAEERAPIRAIVCGISHSEPKPPEEGIAIPSKVGRHLGLDADQSWIVTSEVNIVDWEDPGIVPVASGHWEYGYLPPALAKQVHATILARLKKGRLSMIDRPALEKRRGKRKH